MSLCKDFFLDSAFTDAFVLTYERMRRYQGAWHLEKQLIFPANVLLESANENVLQERLIQYMKVTGCSRQIQKLALEEERFLRFLCGKMNHIEMSRGVICQGITKVTEGPLKGMERQICKIDRHKRLANLRMPEGQKIRYIPAGLEIVEKTI